ncbi:MAG: hypothetical protein ACO3F5_03625 [Gemmatimonadaceae bacterium]
MFGCLGRIGCGLFLIVLGAAGWATKDRWWPEVRRRLPIEMPAVRSRGNVVVEAGRRVHWAIEAGRAGTGRAGGGAA